MASTPQSTLAALDDAIRSELDALNGPAGKKLTATQRGTLLQRILRMRMQIAELTGEKSKLSEEKVVRSHAFRAVVEEIVAALKPWPDAMRAVATALERIERGQKLEG